MSESDRRSRRTLQRERYEGFFAPWALAIAGLLISLAFLFQPSLAVRAVMFLGFLAAAWLSGKRISITGTALVSAGIVAANLFVPVGKVLWRLGAFRVTEIALMDGLGKALTFEGLVFVSKASILPALRLPGRFGSIIAAAFVYYDRVIEYRGSIRPATLIADADSLMLKVWEEPASARPESAESGPEAGKAHPLAGALILSIAVIAAYAVLAVEFFWR